MRVLLTGASGFIGGHTARALVAAEHDVRALVRPTSDRAGLVDLPIERAVGDLSGAGLAAACRDREAVIHVAGLTKARDEAEYQRINCEGTAQLASAAASAGVRRFLYVSSLAAHGPVSTEQYRDPGEPCRPVSPYGRSKAAGEAAALALRDQMAVQVLRPSVVYGPGDRGLLPFFRMARLRLIPVIGRGENRISFIYATDLVEGITALLAHEPDGSPYFHIADAEGPYTWRQLVGALSVAVGRSVAVVPAPALGFSAAAVLMEGVAKVVRRPALLDRGKVAEMKQRAWACDSAALTATTGWTPRTPLAAGLRDTVEWYRQHGWL